MDRHKNVNLVQIKKNYKSDVPTINSQRSSTVLGRIRHTDWIALRISSWLFLSLTYKNLYIDYACEKYNQTIFTSNHSDIFSIYLIKYHTSDITASRTSAIFFFLHFKGIETLNTDLISKRCQ